MTLDRREREQYEMLWADEKSAAHLYRGLAELADDDRRELFEELAETEERHAAHWEQLLAAGGVDVGSPGVPRRTRVLLWAARVFGVDRVLPAIIRAERSDRDRYRTVPAAPTSMAEEEAEHSRTLAMSLSASTGVARAEGRHRATSGGSLRAAVFGINDGLVSNFALIMGVAGGTDAGDVVLLAGIAGLVAGAASMAAGEWISVRSQREVYEREIEIERQELAEFPDDERRELELIYRAKGVDAETAANLAEQVMSNPDTALDTLAREELGLDPEDLGSPWGAAIASFVSFAIGALIPLAPFTVSSGRPALIWAGLLSGAALAAVGAALSTLTGRSTMVSALRMLLVGGGAAAVTYAIGTVVGVTVG